jgi:hypothetical protein
MTAVVGLTNWSVNQVLTSSGLKADFAAIRDVVNGTVMHTNYNSGAHILIQHTWDVAPIFAGGVSVTAGGITVTGGKVTTLASAAVAGAGLNLPHGIVPNTPADGDVWTTTAGMFARINGASLTFPTGTGTNGKVTRWTAAGTLGDASLADNGTYITHAAQPRCFLDATTPTACNASATASAAWSDADIIDVGAMHDPVTNNTRITVPAGAGGLYVVSGQIIFGAASTNGQVLLNWRKNGTTNLLVNDISVAANGGETVTIPFALAATLTAADYIELRVTNNGAQTISFRASVLVEGRWVA